MTNNEMRIVIAEKRGWTRCMARENGDLIGIPPTSSNYVHIGGSNDWAFVPDFCNDLNATHEMEKTLGQDQKRYIFNLQMICGSQPFGGDNYFATARQRAEAFIKTVCPEKWKGDA